MHYDLGYIDLEQRTLQTIDTPFGTRVSSMSQVQTVIYVSGSDLPKMAPGEGFEPPTGRLTAVCSTAELPRTMQVDAGI